MQTLTVHSVHTVDGDTIELTSINNFIKLNIKSRLNIKSLESRQM